ncbi:Helix-turn-helix domain-containing protein [Amycolatopsis pretoriensis]|uniref:Helix-turn-helix domain-containing protein n=1 Tax=Amycolatopsis pretoriensis TaxID=218821 RepID=A0A1H5RBN9_9PSEU|nr:helix-turn-helix transcriptional regulator [Amycolatopsis pretoriensis]SEF35434.1 Helix-turn-helix domain-containing protein [Amycolatopsis pretoriensis]
MKPTSASPGARALAASLRELRMTRGKGLRELARMVRILPQLLSAWEKGQRVASPEDVARLLGALQVDDATYDRMMRLARRAKDDNWLDSNPSDLPPALSGIVEYERTATHITMWSLAIVPGLLQSADYARAVLNGGQLSLAQADIHLVTRLARQRILTKPDPVKLTAIVGEAAIRDEIGGEDVMSDQMDHLLGIADFTNVTLRVLPAKIGYHPGLYGPFVLYEFGDLPTIVHLEHSEATAFLHEVDVVGKYRKQAKLLEGKAMTEDATRALLREVAR